MKTLTQLLASTLLAITIATASPVWGEDNEGSLPSEKTQGGISYVTGGIGQDEAAAFKQAAGGYPLQLQFLRKAEPANQFLADVEVTIQDRRGTTILDDTTDGPFLLANLPNGKYRIKASYDGDTLQKTVWIRSGKHPRVVFLWPTAPADESSEE